MTLHVVILAAGQGTRMRSQIPKVLQKIGGKPMLAHVIDTARALEPAAIHVVFGAGGKAVQSAFATDSDLRWVEQSEQLGTGHAVLKALPAIDDAARVLVLYGDCPLLRVQSLRSLLSTAPQRLSLLTLKADNPAGYGRIIRDADGEVEAIVEERDANDDQRRIREVNSGVLVAPARALRAWLARVQSDNTQGEIYLTDVVSLAVAEGVPIASLILRQPGEALGANDALQLATLERLYQRRQVEELAEQGVRFADPNRIDIRGSLRCGMDVEIDADVVFEGTVVLGDGVRVGPFSMICDSHLAAGTEVRSHCSIEGVETTGAAKIGPFARLRPGTRLARDARVGNFVETKKADIGIGSKVSHLSYVGDAQLGSAVNIGAGTITCNYDGVAKHRTIIEDGAFIGSNTALVAPLTVGRMATVGAGSTLTHDAPDDALTLARAPQTVVPAWKRPSPKDSD